MGLWKITGSYDHKKNDIKETVTRREGGGWKIGDRMNSKLGRTGPRGVPGHGATLDLKQIKYGVE